MRWGRKPIVLTFADFSSGENTADSPLRLGKNQCRIAKNAIVSQKSVKRRMGSLGFGTAAAYLRMLHSYVQLDGTDTILVVHSGILYSVNTTSGALTQLYNMTGAGEAWAVDYRDKCWVCNGTEVVKVENNVAYLVGIAAPTGVTATGADTGGSLAAGVYKLYACYARGANLYSLGQSIADVTIGSGDVGKITIANFTDSGDGQVDKKVIFMTNADGAVYYLYDVASAYGDTTWVIDDTADQTTTSLYSTLASVNYRPPAFEYILAQDNRIWGSVSNVLYYSLKGTTAYDLERFNTQTNGRKITFPYTITGLFAIGVNLYVNTEQGVFVLPESDPLQKEIHTEKRYHFYAMRTVVDWMGGKLGLTQDGVRFFDGKNFYPHDISQSERDKIDRLYTGYDSNSIPCGCVHKTANRTEYHLSFRDVSIHRKTNNVRIVLNLNRLAFHPNGAVSAPWEHWETGANYTLEDSNGILYSAQSHSELSSIYKEWSTRLDQNIYRANRTASYDTTPYDYECRITTQTVLPAIQGWCTWQRAFVVAVLETALKVVATSPDTQASTGDESVDLSDTVDRFGTGVFGTARFASPTRAGGDKVPLDRAVGGKQVKVDIVQNGDDSNYELLETTIEGILTVSRKT